VRNDSSIPHLGEKEEGTQAVEAAVEVDCEVLLVIGADWEGGGPYSAPHIKRGEGVKPFSVVGCGSDDFVAAVTSADTDTGTGTAFLARLLAEARAMFGPHHIGHSGAPSDANGEVIASWRQRVHVEAVRFTGRGPLHRGPGRAGPVWSSREDWDNLLAKYR
jgi:hypothetical protein